MSTERQYCFKVEIRVQEGSFSEDGGFLPCLPKDFMRSGFYVTLEAAKNLELRKELTDKAMEAIWKRLKVPDHER